jgi:hypothetical protein
MRGTKFVFTIHRPNIFDYIELADAMTNGEFRMLEYNLETSPKTGNEHIQGFGVTTRKINVRELRKIFLRAHIDRMRGTIEQNRIYINKQRLKFTLNRDIMT